MYRRRRRAGWPATVAVAVVLVAPSPAGSATARGLDARVVRPAALPAPGARIPRHPARLARALVDTTNRLRTAVDRWRTEGNPAVGGPPHDVELLALYHQRIHRLLREERPLARRTFEALPRREARSARAIVGAARGLRKLTPPLRSRTIRTKRPRPVGVLLRYYREADRRFGVPWSVLAAVNFVESAFGKIRTDSAAGAQGPMQFLPQTWAAYGLGGDVHADRDAILGAANYLRASGAPRRLRRALWRYNPSALYVDGVLAYARRIQADVRNLYVFYSWSLFVRTEKGDVRVTGPGR